MPGPSEAMAEAWYKATGFMHSQFNDEKNRNIVKTLGLFAGSILFMHSCGDILAV